MKNANKINVTANFDEMFNELCKSTNKLALVTTFNKFGYSTTTSPTTTNNINDLYIQVNDKSRIWLRKSRIDFLSLETTCNDLLKVLDNKSLQVIEKTDNGCSFRSHRIECIPKTTEYFNIIMKFLLDNDKILKIAQN